MFVATFYSYKGGVGRTMALVNVAVELCKRGKKVLIVDFDLEAPGIPTFSLCNTNKNKKAKGVVDYVSQYIDQNKAPDIEDFIYECEDKKLDDGKLYVMPAGTADDAYGTRLNNINWNNLYENQFGYLLFEDLKEQWEQILEIDYVLIDSRTGHTDISGICTRQLPDLVALIFFPNEQNLVGMKSIVKFIREQNKEVEIPIEELFVVSNVPRLDDEHDILRKRLKKFEKTLAIAPEKRVTIYHYDSLDLIDQKIFTACRPKTSLAQQYRRLTDAIVSRNIGDPTGALMFLEKLLGKAYKKKGLLLDELNVEEQLYQIETIHSDNGSILHTLARVRLAQGILDGAIKLISQCLDNKYQNIDVHADRVSILGLAGHLDEAVDSLLYVLRSTDARSSQLVSAFRGIVEVAPDSLPSLDEIPALNNMGAMEIMTLTKALESSRKLVQVAATICDVALSHVSDDRDAIEIKNQAILIYISAGRFFDSAKLFNEIPLGDGFDKERHLFNNAIAEWGIKGQPNKDKFKEIIRIHEEEDDVNDMAANQLQCFAIAYGVTGDIINAEQYIDRAYIEIRREGSAFSGWNYLSSIPKSFEKDLDDMIKTLGSSKFIPAVLRGK